MRRWNAFRQLLVISFVAGSSIICFAQGQDSKHLNAQVIKLYKDGKYAEAVPLAQEYAEAIKRQFGEDTPQYATALENLFNLYRAQGLHSEAELHLKRLLKILEENLGPDHPRFAARLGNLAFIYLAQGRYTEAEPLYNHSLKILEEELGPDHPDVAVILQNLASFYLAQGRYAEVESLYKRSLRIIEKTDGKGHPRVATSLNNLAELYRTQGRYAEADSLYKRSLRIIEKTDGKGHPRVATILDNLALLYQAQDRYAEAELLHKRSVRIFEKAYGKDHFDVATSLNNLALLYHGQGRYAEAEPLFKRSLKIREKVLVKDHPHVAVSLHNLASNYLYQGRYTQAEPLSKRALGIREKKLGPDHPDIGPTLNNLAALYKELKRHEDKANIRVRLARMPKPGRRHVRLYFATNRMPSDGAKFSVKLSMVVSFGSVVMQVPEDEVKNRAKRIGESLGQLEKAKTGTLTSADVLKLLRTNNLKTSKEFAEAIRSGQQRAAIFKNQALVFVHGYNNSFEDAMKRATQVSFDLQFDGILMPFSWPSQDSVQDYLPDTEMAQKSIVALVSFVDELRTMLPEVKIHILAHSLGNHVALNALCTIAKRSGEKERKLNFGQVIAAHADVSPADFEKLTRCFKSKVEGTTLYVSENDTALRLRCEGTQCRAGNIARAYSAADVIDTSDMAKGFWRTLAKGFDHDVFVRNPLLFGDITRLILSGERPVEKRTQEFRARKDDKGNTYWAYDKSSDPAAQTTATAGRDLVDILGD